METFDNSFNGTDPSKTKSPIGKFKDLEGVEQFLKELFEVNVNLQLENNPIYINFPHLFEPERFRDYYNIQDFKVNKDGEVVSIDFSYEYAGRKQLFHPHRNTKKFHVDTKGLFYAKRFFPITELPDSIGNFTNLLTLNLRGNTLNFLPDGLFILKNLKKLNLEGVISQKRNWGSLRNLDKIHKISTLTHLKLRKILYKNLPVSIFNLPNLENLDLSENKITLPDEIGNLKSLKVLNLKSNSIIDLPQRFSELYSLEYLDLSGNPLNKFPQPILFLKNLKKLILPPKLAK